MSTAAARALHALRGQAQRSISALSGDLQSVVQASADTNADDEHDPEGSTIAFERAQVRALLDSARDNLVEIDAALARIAAGSYGRCEACGAPIGRERLQARPAARLCVSCAATRRTG
ncbi:MAG: TraR/DksA family transcriptional regulator [Pseudonocardiales bacterium]